jgi:hypothetical protein
MGLPVRQSILTLCASPDTGPVTAPSPISLSKKFEVLTGLRSSILALWVCRPNVTADFGIVTGHFGHRDRPSISAHRDRFGVVTAHFGDRDRRDGAL